MSRADADFAIIGRRQRKIDGPDKTSGRAVYTDDLALPGMLHGKILRSPHPHARIVSIDTERARLKRPRSPQPRLPAPGQREHPLHRQRFLQM